MTKPGQPWEPGGEIPPGDPTPDTARRAEAGKTTGTPGDGQPNVSGGGQRCMRPAGAAETGVVRLITQRGPKCLRRGRSGSGMEGA